MRPWRAFEVPRVIRVTPNAVQIAARGADEYGRKSCTNTFALDRVEYLWPLAKFCKFHKLELPMIVITRSLAEQADYGKRIPDGGVNVLFIDFPLGLSALWN